MVGLALQAIFGLIVVTAASFGAGIGIGILLCGKYRPFERFAFVLLGGFGTLSTALFLIGQFSFTRSSMGLTLGATIVLALTLFHRAFPREGPARAARRRIPKMPVAIISFVLIFMAISGLAEITGDWNNDTVAYHLLGPRVWIREGIIRPVLDNCHTAFPQVQETISATLWSMGGSRAPNFTGFLALAVLLAMAASMALRLGLSDTQAWWVAAIVATMPAVYAGAHGSFVDAIFAAFVIAAARIGFDAQNLGEWAAFGMFCGFAIGTKYTGLIAVPLLLLCILALNWQRHSTRRLAAHVAVAFAAAFLLGAPYYIRNEILLGCPIYPPPPGYTLICSPKYLSADAISAFHAYIRRRGMGMGKGLVAFLLLPFNLTYHTSNFNGAGGIGLCLFALGPVGIWEWRKNDLARILYLFMFLLTLAWFFTEQESRFLIPIYVLGAVFSVLGWQSVLVARGNNSRYLACAVVFVSCIYGLFMIGRAGAGDAKAVFSPRYADFRRQTFIPYLPSFEYLNGHPAVRRILILDRSVTPFYSEKDYVKPVGQWGERTLPGAPSSLQALDLARSHQLDVTHILDVNSDNSAFQVDPGAPGLVLVFEAENQRVYRVE